MIRINLLPVREERRKQHLQQLAAMLAATVVGAVALSGLFHWSVRSDIRQGEANVKRLEKEIERFRPQLEKVEEYKKTKAQIEQKLEVIEKLERSRSGPVRMLEQLALHSPEKLWLTQLVVNGDKARIEGLSLDNELVASFMTALEESPFFGQVELESTEAKSVRGFRLNAFEIGTAVLTPDPEKLDSETGTQTAAADVAGGHGR